MINWFSGVILYTLYVLCQTLYYLILCKIKDDDLRYVVCNVNIKNFGQILMKILKFDRLEIDMHEIEFHVISMLLIQT